MDRMRFDSRWVSLVLKCVSTVSYAVSINSKMGKFFQPSKGLRQGGPLSPFLFLLCSEGLSSLMRLVVQENRIQGAKASRRGSIISHLLFVDDCMLFGEASDDGVRVLKEILQEYEICSSQCVNYEKSTVMYSSNTPEVRRTMLSNLLRVRYSNNLEKYLGLPNMVGRRKRVAFQNFTDRFKKQMARWNMKFLLQRGKEVYIKSVLQAILTYSMACFLLSKSFYGDLNSIMARF